MAAFAEQFAEFSDTLCDVMEDVQLDARKRQFIWPDGERLDIVQSIARIHQRYPDMRRDWIEEYLLLLPRFSDSNSDLAIDFAGRRIPFPIQESDDSRSAERAVQGRTECGDCCVEG